MSTTDTQPALEKIDDWAHDVATDIARLEGKTTTQAHFDYTSYVQQRLVALRQRFDAGAVSVVSTDAETAQPAPTTGAIEVTPDRGMDRYTGQKITNKTAHIKQSLTDIWTTSLRQPAGSNQLMGGRVERRDYGSLIPSLIDAPLNESTILNILHAAAESALKWEHRVSKLLAIVPEVSAGKLRLGVLAEDEDGNAIDFYEVLT